MSSKTQSVATLAGLLIGLIALIAAVGVTRCGHGPPRTGLAAGPARGWCKAPADAAWKRALADGLVALSRRASVVPWALAGDGRTFFASVYSRRISGVVRVDAASSAVTVIKRFADPRTDQADGSFDGRWLVWDEYHSLLGSDDFTTWSWDSRTGQLRKIGAAERSPSGEFWPSPWRQPDVHGGFAAWTQGSGAGGIGDVHVFDLRSGKDRVVRHGHPAGAFLLAGGLVVWPESLKPGALTLMQAAEVASGRRVAAPAAFRTMRGVSGLATDGTALAYPNDDYTSLWWSPSLEALPLRVFATANAASHIDNSVQVAGGYAAFGVPPALFLAETEAHRYVQISSGGFALLDARSLILLKPSRKKAVHPVSDVVFRSLAALPPLPTCS